MGHEHGKYGNAFPRPAPESVTNVTASPVEEIVDVQVRSFWLYFPTNESQKPSLLALRITVPGLGRASIHILAKRNWQFALAVCTGSLLRPLYSFESFFRRSFKHQARYISGARCNILAARRQLCARRDVPRQLAGNKRRGTTY